tara:strand:+ start:67251 stop:67508 length:258 start_codon:yes stop_codon:yes gene_type:complete
MALVRSITIKTEFIPELTEIYGEFWPENIIDPNGDGVALIPNTQTKAQYAAETFDAEWKESVKNRVISYRLNVAKNSIDNTEIIE